MNANDLMALRYKTYLHQSCQQTMLTGLFRLGRQMSLFIVVIVTNDVDRIIRQTEPRPRPCYRETAREPL